MALRFTICRVAREQANGGESNSAMDVIIPSVRLPFKTKTGIVFAIFGGRPDTLKTP